MTTTLHHLRHRVTGATPDPRVLLTACGLRFVAGTATPVHEPARGRCGRCFGG